MRRGVARGEKTDGKGNQQSEKRSGQSHLHGLQGGAQHGLRECIVPPALFDACLGFAERQRQEEFRQRQISWKKITLGIGHLGKIRWQHAAHSNGDLRDTLNQFSRPELCPLKGPRHYQHSDTQGNERSCSPSWRRRGFKKDIRLAFSHGLLSQGYPSNIRDALKTALRAYGPAMLDSNPPIVTFLSPANLPWIACSVSSRNESGSD